MSRFTYDAILIPSGGDFESRRDYGRLVPLATSPLSRANDNSAAPFRCGRVPHPEAYMDYVDTKTCEQPWGHYVR